MAADPQVTVVDLATPRIREILEALAPAQRRSMLARLGKELERQLKAHFLQRDQNTPNKQGWPRSHFWAREVRDKTALREVTSERAVVGIDSAPFRFKVRGGTIRPGPGRRLLAIPKRPEVYGVLPRAHTIPGIFFKICGGRMYLAARDGQALRIYWRLVPYVIQPADQDALPRTELLQAALEKRAEDELVRIFTKR